MHGPTLVPILMPEGDSLVANLRLRLERTFGDRFHLASCWFDAEMCYDPSRGQYSSTWLLEELLRPPWNPEGRILGVTSVDLFIPVLTYVFGEAQLGGTAAVVSMHRLRSEAYGLPANRQLLEDRLAKEAVHELGHTYDLAHCTDPSCVMRSSRYVEEIDLKKDRFCSSCIVAVAPAHSRA